MLLYTEPLICGYNHINIAIASAGIEPETFNSAFFAVLLLRVTYFVHKSK